MLEYGKTLLVLFIIGFVVMELAVDRFKEMGWKYVAERWYEKLIMIIGWPFILILYLYSFLEDED